MIVDFDVPVEGRTLAPGMPLYVWDADLLLLDSGGAGPGATAKNAYRPVLARRRR